MDPPARLELFRYYVVGGLSIHPADVSNGLGRWAVCCCLFFVANEVHVIQCPVSLRYPKEFHFLNRKIRKSKKEK